MKRLLFTVLLYLVLIFSLGVAVSAQLVVVPASSASLKAVQVDVCRFPYLSAFLPPASCDAPEITSTPIISAIVGQSYTYDVNAVDPNGDTLTYSLSTLPNSMAINPSTGVITWVPLSSQLGSNNVVVKVSDGTNEDTQSFTITVTSAPSPGLCNVGDLEINDVDFDDDEVRPKDKMEFEIEVENTGEEDIEDIKVEVALWDETENKRVEVEKSYKFDLDEDEDKVVTIEMEIPLVDADNDHVIIVTVSETGNEDEQCLAEEHSIDIETEDDDIILDRISLSPTTLSCGETGGFSVSIENIGEDDQEDAELVVENADLGISERFGFDLDQGDDITKQGTFIIRETVNSEKVANGNYNIQFSLYTEDGDLMDSESRQITVTGCATDVTDDSDDDDGIVIDVSAGGSEGGITDFGSGTNVQPRSRRDVLDLALWVIADIALLVIVISLIVLAVKRMNRKQKKEEPVF